MFDGVCPVVNVPFNEDYSIDYVGLGNIVEFIRSKEIKSVCLFAFNSEPYKLSLAEKKEVTKYFLKRVGRTLETLIGIVENSIGDCIELGRCAKGYGADGIILYPPALSTPSGDSLVEYFKIISEAVDLPVMIQDNPRSTGVTMSLDMLLSAYQDIENFSYIKVECPIPMRKLKNIVEKTEGKLKCYSGNGGIYAIEAFLNGASGIMPGVILCDEFNKITKLLKSGETDKARDLFEKILPFAWYEDQSLEFYVSSEKYLLKKLGIIKSDTVRKPCTTLFENEKAELNILYERMKNGFN